MMKGGLIMKESMDRNDKIFDIILDEAFDKYAKDAASYEPETEMTEEDIRIMDSKKDNIYNNIMKEIDKDNKKKSPFKLVIPLVAILILVVAYSSNAFAFRTFLHQTFMSLTGTDLNFNTKKLVFEDYDNIVNFENKDEIIVPGWLPDNIQLQKMQDEFENLNLYYKNEQFWLSLRLKSSLDRADTKIETENNNYIIKKDKVLDMECSIVEIDSESELKTYVVYWNSNYVNYSMMTNLPENDFKKVLKNLQYLED